MHVLPKDRYLETYTVRVHNMACKVVEVTHWERGLRRTTEQNYDANLKKSGTNYIIT